MLKCTRDRELGLFPELAMAAAAELDLDSVARGGRIQRGVEWGQEVAGVPRVAVEQQEVACGPPRRRAVPLCAGSRGSREGERWKMKAGPFCNF